MIGAGEHTVSALDFKRQPRLLKQLHHVLIGKAVKAAEQKLAVCHNGSKKFFHITGICHIAASLSCNKQLLSQLFIFFIQADFTALSCSGYCGNHSCRTSACDDNMLFFIHESSLVLCRGIYSVLNVSIPHFSIK